MGVDPRDVALESLREELKTEKHYHKAYYEKGLKYLEEITALKAELEAMREQCRDEEDKHSETCFERNSLRNEITSLKSLIKELVGDLENLQKVGDIGMHDHMSADIEYGNCSACIVRSAIAKAKEVL